MAHGRQNYLRLGAAAIGASSLVATAQGFDGAAMRSGEGDVVEFREEEPMQRRGDPVRHFETQRRHTDGRLLDVSITVSPIWSGSCGSGSARVREGKDRH